MVVGILAGIPTTTSTGTYIWWRTATGNNLDLTLPIGMEKETFYSDLPRKWTTIFPFFIIVIGLPSEKERTTPVQRMILSSVSSF